MRRLIAAVNVRGATRRLSTQAPIVVDALGQTPKDAEGARELYDEWAKTYDDSLISWGYMAPSRVAETVLGKFGHVDLDGAVIDLGCGTGMAGEALRRHGFKGDIHGVDISPRSCELALSKEDVYSKTITASLEEGLREIEDNTFDAAVCVGVTSYVEDFDAFFGAVTRICKPGALVCMTHRCPLWVDDVRGRKQSSERLEADGMWELQQVGEPEPYMPKNPDPAESAKTIRLLLWRVL